MPRRLKSVKNILIEDIDEDLYYRALIVKAKLRAKTWKDFLRKVVEHFERM